MAIADQITVLRDGQSVFTAPASKTTQTLLVQKMVGRELGELYPPRPTESAVDNAAFVALPPGAWAKGNLKGRRGFWTCRSRSLPGNRRDLRTARRGSRAASAPVWRLGLSAKWQRAAQRKAACAAEPE